MSNVARMNVAATIEICPGNKEEKSIVSLIAAYTLKYRWNKENWVIPQPLNLPIQYNMHVWHSLNLGTWWTQIW